MADALTVEYLHFYPLDNSRAHNTNKYELVYEEVSPVPIVRRGQPFEGILRFNRPYDEASDDVKLVFTLGNQHRLGTQGSMYLRNEPDTDKDAWRATILKTRQDSVHFTVKTPVTLPVGAWSVRVVTVVKQTYKREFYNYDQNIFILFNPWNPDDQTYMEDTSLLQEYVLNDVGKVWKGPRVETTRGTPWVYGQFDANVLPACLYTLDKAKIPYQYRGDPIKLTRVISRIVNSNNDDGVLAGRWDGEYEDGTAPSDWTGSIEILTQYHQTGRSVEYGQCWVFAGVVTTVCRALGIPCRDVCNLVSAHDANSTLTIDKYYAEDMAELDYDPNNPDGADSVWNYHVWNDVWMARPDLPPGFGGWQAIDATPQETSSGFYQCGPAPLEAIKQGILGIGYDVEFMLATVNADVMRWRKDPESENGYSIVETIKDRIGLMILTKKPFVFDPNGDKDREDITDQYKFRERTVSERMALMNGVRHSERAKRYYAVATKNDISFKLRDIDSIFIGKEFNIIVDIQNNSDQARNVKAYLIATSLFYNGVNAAVLKKVEGRIYVGPNQREQISILVTAEQYLPKLVEYSNVKISAMALVDETKQAWAEDDLFQIIKPNISIQFQEDLIIKKPSVARLSVENPLDYPLTECEFRVTSPGILGRTLRFKANDVDAHKLLTAELPVEPTKIGTINFVATFKSAELKDISGAASVEVLEG